MGLTDYTTLQYHLANKTYIEFILKLISGIAGIILNIVFIPKVGLAGVGIGTLGANFLYYFLSAIIVLPGLGLRYPMKTFGFMAISFVPMGLFYYLMKDMSFIAPIIQMMILMAVFYAVYFLLNNKIFKTSTD